MKELLILSNSSSEAYIDRLILTSFRVELDYLTTQSATFTGRLSGGNNDIPVGSFVSCNLDGSHWFFGAVCGVKKDTSKGTTTVSAVDMNFFLTSQIVLKPFSSWTTTALDYVLAQLKSSTKGCPDWMTYNADDANTTFVSPESWKDDQTTTALEAIQTIENTVKDTNGDKFYIGHEWKWNTDDDRKVLLYFEILSPTPTQSIDLGEKFISSVNVSSQDSGTPSFYVFQPSVENTTNTRTFIYGLVKNGDNYTVSANYLDDNLVKGLFLRKVKVYKDDDYDLTAFEQEALSQLLPSGYPQEISFSTRINTPIGSYTSFLKSLFPGKKLLLSGVPGYPNSTVSTVVTKLSFTEEEGMMKVTCGWNRGSLTDKVKMRRESSGTVNSTIIENDDYKTGMTKEMNWD
jgi:hypothetical protein